jgi:hypothetical protein
MPKDFYSSGSEKRSKKKDKFKRKKFFPYKHGGKWRTEEANKKQ